VRSALPLHSHHTCTAPHRTPHPALRKTHTHTHLGRRPPNSFENANALHQLRCGGVLEAVRISCAGFPNKRPFPDFVEHFWQLAPELYHKPEMSDRCGPFGVRFFLWGIGAF